MNKRQRPSQKKRSAAVAAVVCFVAAIALVGTYTFNDYKRTQQKEKLALAEEDDTKDEKKKEPAEEANNLVINNKVDDEPEEKPEEPTPEDTTEQTDSTDVQQTEGSSRAITFNENSQLLWPVNGTIIMSYSMDKTVYFQTLDQYKYNPAVVISGAEGDQVICGTTGIVKSIDVTAETGTTVNVDIGNG